MPARASMIAAIVAAVACAAAPTASAQSFPERTVEIVVPFSPGAVTDTLARALAESLSTQLGQRFVVVNKPGATGAIGSLAVARARPDGYTLLFTAAVVLTVVPQTVRQASYDHHSFEPICQTFVNEMVIVTRSNSAFKTVSDLVRAAKARPGALNYGHLGNASIPHLAMVEFAQAASIELNAVPFKGDADVVQQVYGGQLDFGSITLSSASGSALRALGLFADARNPMIPELATMREHGFNVAPASFGGLLAPAGLPPDIKRKLGEACEIAARGPSYAQLARRMYQPTNYYADGDSFAKKLEQDFEVKARLLSTLGISN